jgi:hypothetical protein
LKFKRKIIARVDQNNQHGGSENDADHYSDHTFQPGIARLHCMLQLDQLRIAVCPVHASGVPAKRLVKRNSS